MHFMLETIIAAHLLGVDPFDQPAVEEGKVLAKQYLSLSSPLVPRKVDPGRKPADYAIMALGSRLRGNERASERAQPNESVMIRITDTIASTTPN